MLFYKFFQYVYLNLKQQTGQQKPPRSSFWYMMFSYLQNEIIHIVHGVRFE